MIPFTDVKSREKLMSRMKKSHIFPLIFAGNRKIEGRRELCSGLFVHYYIISRILPPKLLPGPFRMLEFSRKRPRGGVSDHTEQVVTPTGPVQQDTREWAPAPSP
jgi:hypothetical protein